MSRSIDAAVYAALQAKSIVSRDFVWFTVKDLITGSPVTDGYWSDIGPLTASVIDPDTGSSVSRSWVGAASLISISDITLVSSITVQNITITMSQVADHVNALVRGYNCKLGGVQVFRGLFNLDTRVLVAPATPRFVGTIDDITITTPRDGGVGSVVVTCTSSTQEMTRSSPDTRSDASQRLRSATDDFFADVAVVGTWEQFWGRAGGTLASNSGGSFKNGNKGG